MHHTLENLEAVYVMTSCTCHSSPTPGYISQWYQWAMFVGRWVVFLQQLRFRNISSFSAGSLALRCPWILSYLPQASVACYFLRLNYAVIYAAALFFFFSVFLEVISVKHVVID